MIRSDRIQPEKQIAAAGEDEYPDRLDCPRSPQMADGFDGRVAVGCDRGAKKKARWDPDVRKRFDAVGG